MKPADTMDRVWPLANSLSARTCHCSSKHWQSWRPCSFYPFPGCVQIKTSSTSDGLGGRDWVRPKGGGALLGQGRPGGGRHLPCHSQVHRSPTQPPQSPYHQNLFHSGRVFPGQDPEAAGLALFAGFDDGHIASYDGHHLTHEKSWQAHKVSFKDWKNYCESEGFWGECLSSGASWQDNLPLLGITLWRTGSASYFKI